MGYFETGLLESLFEVFFQDRESGVVADQNGNPIFVNARYLSDYGTLPQAVKITQSYMKLQPGQMAILNDPYSGGTQLSTLTLITCVEIGSKKTNFPMILGLRYPLRPNLRWAESIEDEGLRIPPTLIGDQNGIYEDILSAITNHPLCPDDFGRYINEWLTKQKSPQKF
ncbi:MAG: hydantoinase B/oxoprolinase family protein [Bdellovibrionales bacterium]|nr:hydantoinase B/oxoprolinase family protein [Bdellovibrionales bacterium]